MSILSINGTRKCGQEVRDDNATAVIAMGNVVKNSLGPAGLDKMIVDDLGELNITNDGATILKLIEVEHPAAKILVELANLQDKEVGDGTTSVVLMAAELVRRGNELVKNSIHPTVVIAGYQQAKKEACKFVAENLAYKVSDLGPDCLKNAAMTAMSSKVIGKAAEHFAEIAVRAMLNVAKHHKDHTKGGSIEYAVKDVSLLKIRGDGLLDSRLVEGMALRTSRTLSSMGMPSGLKNAKIAFIDFDLRKDKLPFNVKVVVDDPNNLEAIRDEETATTERRVGLLLDAGANVILSSRAIDDFVLNAVSRKGGIALKNVPREDLKRIASATGGHLLTSLASIDAKDFSERVPAEALGKAAEISEERVGDVAHLIVVKAKESKGAQTVLLRGPSDYALEEVERSLHDVICVLKRILESGRVVVGGGVVEAALSVYLENFAETIGSREQLAIAEFAWSLLTIPKALSTNGAFDSTDLLASLRAAHNAVISDGKTEYKNVGLNLADGSLRDNLKAGVFEPAMSKIKSIRFATEAAIAILRIDDSITVAPKASPARDPRYR